LTPFGIKINGGLRVSEYIYLIKEEENKK